MSKQTNLKQNDPRWADYPYAGETMAPAGCGPTSVADLLGHNEPITVANWMQTNGYASNGSGTYHSGIPAALRAFGYNGEQITSHSLAGVMDCSEFNAFKAHIQKGFCGVILFGGTTTGCRNDYWSRAGHYCACVGYNNGMFLIYDPAWAARDGYHDWGDIAGDVKHLFTSTVRWKKAEDDFMFTMKPVRLGDNSVDAYQLQVQMRARGFKGADGKEVALDFSAGNNTFFAWSNYVDARKKQGVTSLKKDVVDKNGWSDLFGKPSE